MMTDRGRLPAADDGDWEWLLFEQSNVVTTSQAVSHLGRGKVRHLVAAKQWRRICRGVLLTYDGPLTTPQQLWAGVLAAGRGVVLAGIAAAVDGGLRGVRAGRVDVLVPGTHGHGRLLQRLPIDMPPVFVHRTGVLLRSDLQVGRPRRTVMARSVVDAASWARTDDEARQILSAACQQRRVTPAEILEVAGRLTRARRHRLTVETAADLAGGAQALSEIDFVRLCRRSGLPAPDLQERRVDTSGRVRYLDAYWRDRRLHVEVDGAHHMDAAHWEADMRRQNDVWIAGDRVLRFSAFQVRHRPAEVVAQLRRALAAGPIESTWGRPATLSTLDRQPHRFRGRERRVVGAVERGADEGFAAFGAE